MLQMMRAKGPAFYRERWERARKIIDDLALTTTDWTVPKEFEEFVVELHPGLRQVTARTKDSEWIRAFCTHKGCKLLPAPWRLKCSRHLLEEQEEVEAMVDNPADQNSAATCTEWAPCTVASTLGDATLLPVPATSSDALGKVTLSPVPSTSRAAIGDVTLSPVPSTSRAAMGKATWSPVPSRSMGSRRSSDNSSTESPVKRFTENDYICDIFRGALVSAPEKSPVIWIDSDDEDDEKDLS